MDNGYNRFVEQMKKKCGVLRNAKFQNMEQQLERINRELLYLSSLQTGLFIEGEPFNILIAFKLDCTLREWLCHPKDPVPYGLQSGVIYEIVCECRAAYIGQTGR